MTRMIKPARLVLCAAVLALLAPAAARAEIVDFDPADGESPTIIAQDELDLMDGLGGSIYSFWLSEVAPDGRLAVADIDDFPTIVDLSSGEETPFDDEPDGFSPYGPFVWLDESTLGQVEQTVEQEAEDEPVVITYYRSTVAAATGEVTTEVLDALSDLGGFLVGFSPDLEQLLVILPPEGGPFMPPTREVTVGIPDDFGRTDRPLPDGIDASDDLPGAVGTMPFGTMTVQQEVTRIVLVSAADGAVKELTTLPAGTAVLGLAWRPDGQRLVLGTTTLVDWDGDRERDNEPANTPREPNLDTVAVQEALGNIAPEDNPLLQTTQLRLYDTTDGSEVRAVQNASFPEGTFAGFAWSPSGEHALLSLALRSELTGRAHPVYSFPSGMATHLLDGQTLADQGPIEGEGLGSLGARIAFADDETLVAAVPDGVNTRIDTIALADRTVTSAWSRPGSMWQMMAGGGRVTFNHTTVDQPMELWSADVADVQGSAAPVTIANEAVAEASHLAAHPVAWTTSDGAELSGILVMHEDAGYPPAEPGPLVVWQQGGPGGQMTNDFGTSVEGPYSVLPHFGLPVLVVNAAGRTVGDPAFFSAMADGTHFGQLDIDQIKEGVDALVARGIVDPDRVGITGCSYGGYFALQSIRRHPELYAAANAQCSLVDLFEEFTYGFAPFVAYLTGTAPMADPAEYLADSPLYGSKDVTTPTLLFHGTEDFLPFQLLNNYHDQLMLNGTPVSFLRVAGEEHGFGYEASQRYAAQLQLEWFRDHLGVPDDWEPDPNVRSDIRIFMPSAVAGAALLENAP